MADAPAKFSLVHASRGRPALCPKTAREWISKASGNNSLEYILSLDEDDAANYAKVIEELRPIVDLKVKIAPNTCMVQAVNVATPLATGDIIIFVPDDMGCPERWDSSLLERLARSKFRLGDEFCFYVRDGIHADPYELQTHPYVSKALYKRLGYLYHPAYMSVYADNDFTAVTKGLGCIVDATDLLFEHRHPMVGKAPWDDTYTHENSYAAGDHGVATFQRRRLYGFPPLAPHGRPELQA